MNLSSSNKPSQPESEKLSMGRIMLLSTLKSLFQHLIEDSCFKTGYWKKEKLFICTTSNPDCVFVPREHLQRAL